VLPRSCRPRVLFCRSRRALTSHSGKSGGTLHPLPTNAMVQVPSKQREIIMPMTTVSASTPRYVLLDEVCRFGPKVMPLHGGVECSPIYGFSDKGCYDEFCAKSGLELRPYPLVIGYLQNQIKALGDRLKLVVIDAAGPNELYLCAATMEAVLEAQENRATHVTAGYRLILDQEANAYRVEETAS
jgi:hypothetical protein